MTQQGDCVVVLKTVKADHDWGTIAIPGMLGTVTETAYGGSAMPLVEFDTPLIYNDFPLALDEFLPYVSWERNGDGTSERVAAYPGETLEIALYQPYPDASCFSIWVGAYRPDCDDYIELGDRRTTIPVDSDDLFFNVFFAQAWAAWQRGLNGKEIANV